MGARSAAASVARHLGGVAVEATLVAALVATIALVFSPVYAPAKFLAGTDSAFAARGGHHGAAAALACSVTPNPVDVGGLYTVSGAGYAPDLLILVAAQDSHGTQYMPSATDSSGAFAVSTYASWAGTSSVTVFDSSGQKATVLGTCSFVVQ